MSSFIRSILGPRLYFLYKTSTRTASAQYQTGLCEKFGDVIVQWINFWWNFLVCTAPVTLPYAYRRGSEEYLHSTGRFAGSVLIALAGALLVRGIGRCLTREYREFLEVLRLAHRDPSPRNMGQLLSYDFDPQALPVTFRASPSGSLPSVRPPRRAGGIVSNILDIPCRIVSYLVMWSVGRRLVYPGSIRLLGAAMGPFLLQGRIKLVETYGGRRARLMAADGNKIDTMFVDRRDKGEFPNGGKLVLVCEGNAGFYEAGSMGTPLEAGYSVLGWNHPGFCGSSGVPCPQSEANAVDAVMQFALAQRGFAAEDVVIYAWSIGGFAAVCATAQHPQVGALILDATFDDLMPLALGAMPGVFQAVVRRSVRDHMDLNVAALLSRYPGPVRLVRRTQDEVITTDQDNHVGSNRGNFLLLKLLICRYTDLFRDQAVLGDLQGWLAEDPDSKAAMYQSLELDQQACLGVLREAAGEGGGYPLALVEGLERRGLTKTEMALFLADLYLTDFDSPHNNPLPASKFLMPSRHLQAIL